MAKILVVEDDKNTNDVISDFLVDAGYEVVSVHDGEQALRQFPENVIDLVILDIMLPKVDGLTVLKNIRVSSQVPVLMLTAMEDEHTQVISFDRMADDYITKPFSHVLKGVSAEFEAGKVYTIVGKSGSGKSTLLSLIAGLDICTGVEILHGETDLKNLDRDEYRAKGIGVVFQAFNLITNSTAIENIVLSMHISASDEKDKKSYACALLEKVGIDRETADRKVLKLSGGEQQRVGIARALAHNPNIIIADEPTGNLDTDTENDILKILASLAHEPPENGVEKCVIIVTHLKKVTTIADEVLVMKDGNLTFERQGR